MLNKLFGNQINSTTGQIVKTSGAEPECHFFSMLLKNFSSSIYFFSHRT